MTTTTELHTAIYTTQTLLKQAADVIEHNAKSLAEAHTKNGIIEDREVQAAVESDTDLVAHLRAAALPWDQRHKQPEPTGSMGMPVSCGKPLCSPGDHHPLCKLAEQPAQQEPDKLLHIGERDCLLDVDEEAWRSLVENRGGCRCHISPPCGACSDPISEKEMNEVGYTYIAPQPPAQQEPLFKEFIKWAGAQGYDCAQTCNSDTGEWIVLNPMTADLWKAWQAAHGITEGNT